MFEKTIKEKIEYCSNCNNSKPNFNLLFCEAHKKSMGYREHCACWTEKRKEKAEKEDDLDPFEEF